MGADVKHVDNNLDLHAGSLHDALDQYCCPPARLTSTPMKTPVSGVYMTRTSAKFLLAVLSRLLSSLAKHACTCPHIRRLTHASEGRHGRDASRPHRLFQRMVVAGISTMATPDAKITARSAAETTGIEFNVDDKSAVDCKGIAQYSLQGQTLHLNSSHPPTGRPEMAGLADPTPVG